MSRDAVARYEAHHHLVPVLTARFGGRDDCEDLRGAVSLALWQAAQRWDPARGHATGVRFSQYAKLRMIGAVLDWRRAEKKHHETDQLGDADISDGGRAARLVEARIEVRELQVEWRAALAVARSVVSPTAYAVWRDHLLGRSVSQIARRRRWSNATVAHLLWTAERRLMATGVFRT